MRKSNFSIYGNFWKLARNPVTAFQALDTQPITYNTFPNRAFPTQNFVYQRFTHHNFPQQNTPTLKKHLTFRLELAYDIIMNNMDNFTYIKSYIKGSYNGELNANTIPHDMTLVQYFHYVGKEAWAELITSAMYEEGLLS
jgi:hypothetical protein